MLHGDRWPVKQGTDTHLPTSSKHVDFQRNAFILTVFKICTVRFFAFFCFWVCTTGRDCPTGKRRAFTGQSWRKIFSKTSRSCLFVKIKGFQTASTKSAVLLPLVTGLEHRVHHTKTWSTTWSTKQHSNVQTIRSKSLFEFSSRTRYRLKALIKLFQTVSMPTRERKNWMRTSELNLRNVLLGTVHNN